MKLLHSPNCEIGRRGYRPEAIVLHTTEGNLKGDLSWVGNPKSQVSYHYIIGTDLEIYEIVNPENTAWHAGLVKNSFWTLLKKEVNPNFYTIGIAFTGSAEAGINFEMQMTGLRLIRDLMRRYKIPFDTQHLIRHTDIRSDKKDPGASINLGTLSFFASLP